MVVAPGSLQGSHGAGPQADHRAWRWRGAGRGTRQLRRDASTTPNKADGTPPPVHKPPFAPGSRLGHRSLQHKASAPPRHINTPTFLPRPPTSVASSPKLLRKSCPSSPFQSHLIANMPPRADPTAAGRGRGRGASRGTTPSRGVSRGAGPVIGGRGGGVPAAAGLPDSSPHITTVGVKRSAFGSSGRALQIFTNHFEVQIPEDNIHHYDGASSSPYKLTSIHP